MITKFDKTYRIQLSISGNTLTYSECKIIADVDGWLTFEDKFKKKFTVNKNSIVIIEEV